MNTRLAVIAFGGVVVGSIACESSAPTALPTEGMPSFAAAPKKSTPITGEIDLSGPVAGLNITNPQCITVDLDALLARFKNCILLGALVGGLEGDVAAELDGKQNVATLAATVHGHVVLDVCHDVLGCGTFTGPFKSEAETGGKSTITVNAHGTGDFHTMQLRLTAVERGITNIFDVDGVIF